MALRIRKLATGCRVSKRNQSAAQIVDHFARRRLPHDIAYHLGPLLSRQPAIVRIRRLPLAFQISGQELTEDALSRAWVESFGQALLRALAYPTGIGPFEVFRAASVGEFVASAIFDQLRGDTSRRWAYAEFEELLESGGIAGAVALLCRWPRETLAALFWLERHGVVEKLLVQLDEGLLEQIMATLEAASAFPESTASAGKSNLTAHKLLLAANLVSESPPRNLALLNSRRFALRLYIQSAAGGTLWRTPRALLDVLCVLKCLVEKSPSLDWPDELETLKSGEPAAERLRQVLQEIRVAPHAPAAERLLQSLEELRGRFNLTIPGNTSKSRQFRSECCGLFFLCETLLRAGWVRKWQELSFFEAGGVSCLLAGLSKRLVKQGKLDFNPLDPGLALFSGYSSEADLAHCRGLFESAPLEACRAVLEAAGSKEAPAVELNRWPSTLEVLAEKLVQEFAAQIRGFRRATRQSIVNSFLRRSGQITLTEEKIVVAPDASPFLVALHICGMDASLESVPWIGNRRLEFELGEL